MRWLLTITFFFYSCSLFARKADTQTLETTIAAFNKALVNKDSAALKQLMSDKLAYGHSNGWIQTKKEVISDLYNGKLTYKAINPADAQLTMEGNTVAARMNAEVEIVMDGKPLQLKLKILQIWIWKNRHWELFARQSVKI